MHRKILQFSLAAISPLLISACASQSNLCEDIMEVKDQEQQCLVLEKAMRNPKNPQMALTARQRFESECQNFRYYRDDYDTICKKGEQPIGKPIGEAIDKPAGKPALKGAASDN